MGTLFNLVSEPWIPCITLDNQSRELSLSDALRQAHEIREIYTDSPLITASLHRLLLAILHRNFGPKNLDAWVSLWQKGRFENTVLAAYWDKWNSRFNLLDPERPFYQVIDEETLTAEKHSITKLAQELASGNNDTLFDHSYKDNPRPISLAQAARLIVATQNYSIQGGNSKPFNFSKAPLIAGAFTLIIGANLFETLLFNMVRYSKERPMPNLVSDCPCWERNAPLSPAKRMPDGYLDYLTWQSRRIHLISHENNAGTLVQGVQVLQGHAVSDENLMDPMMAFESPNKKIGALCFKKDTVLWRDFHALLVREAKMERSSQTMEQLAELNEKHPELNLNPQGMNIFGISNDQGKVFLWRHERLPLHIAYLHQEHLAARLKEIIMLADSTAKGLRYVLFRIAELLIVPTGERKPAKEDVNKLVNSFPCLTQFWASLEVPFYEVYSQLPTDPDKAREVWASVLRQNARDSFNIIRNSLDGSARTLKAVTVAEKILHVKLKQIIPTMEGGER